MACRRVLVLCGKTYPDRLWCTWEMCIVFSFASPEQALERLRFEVLGEDPDGNILERMRQFQVKNARCYDPNEQARILQVIGTMGANRFDERIRELAEAISAALHMPNVSSFTSTLSIRRPRNSVAATRTASVVTWKSAASELATTAEGPEEDCDEVEGTVSITSI
eukprot:TRINITY_DN4210_c0_g3_i2.p1 TRINITY_DN4210_c0_g3~~TRINITY_DN4210_c0_g3_i2.p1  ORF type:complete len:166 (+),score=23.11 TRINITY_DN4210_c0_g3_i2:517-1014(+)